MSRSSPGRYAVHEFAKNVFCGRGVRRQGPGAAVHAAGRRRVGRRRSRRHRALVYKIFGDYADGTYIGVDTTHAHLNMPAAFMWAVGPREPADARHVRAAGRIELEDRHAAVPDDRSVHVHGAESAVLHGQPDGAVGLRDEHVLGAERRRHAGELPPRRARATDRRRTSTSSRSSSQRLVREQMAVFGEFPKYEPGYYTFLLDYVAVGRRRRHGASQQHVDLEPGLSLQDAAGPAAGARHDLARVLPQLERRAHPAGRARAVRFHAREHHVLPVARRRLHAVLRAAAADARGARPQASAGRTPASPSSTARAARCDRPCR